MGEVVRGQVRLFYRDEGEGDVVVFHNGGGGDGAAWKTAGYVDAAPPGRYLLVDHRGHGRSSQPADVRAHAIDEYVEDVVAVLDAAGVDRASCVGYSDGARVLYRLAAHHADRVQAIVGMGGVVGPDASHDGRRTLSEHVRRVGMRSWLEEMSAGETQPAPPWFLDNLATTPTEMFALELEAWADAPTECADFPKIAAPTLVICGEHENDDHAAEAAAAALPNGTAVVLPAFGHLQTFWRADVTAPVIRDFLTRQGQP